VIECEQPTRKTRRGKGKSDPIDAHLAVLTALRLEVSKLPTPRARRRPRGAAHPAVRTPGTDHHRASQPAPGAAARRRRRRPHPGPKPPDRHRPGHLGPAPAAPSRSATARSAASR
jgi:hypothetical protein